MEMIPAAIRTRINLRMRDYGCALSLFTHNSVLSETYDPASHVLEQKMNKISFSIGVLSVMTLTSVSTLSMASESPDLIFKKSTVWKLLTPNDKLAVYGLDDPEVEGVACHYTTPLKGGLSGMFGVAEEVSDISLACRQIGPIRFKSRFDQGDVVFSERRSLIFKKMQIVRGCDAKRNTLVYLVYTDRIIDGSPQNSTSTVPIMPWGASEPPKCKDWMKD
jgi:CreA protein